MRPRPAVCTDAVAARQALGEGRDVVLVVAAAEDAQLDATLDGLRAVADVAGGADVAGRLAILVGDADDPVDLAAAAEMADEVFGRREVGRLREDASTVGTESAPGCSRPDARRNQP